MTFGEVVLESKLFEYSKEYYDLLKESYEISLMETYIESLDFVRNGGYEYVAEASGITIKTDNYFVESADDNQYEELCKAYEEKVGNFLGNIKAGFDKLLSKVIPFFTRIANKFDATCQQGDRLTNYLSTIEDGGEDAKQIGEIIKKCINDTKFAGYLLSGDSQKAYNPNKKLQSVPPKTLLAITLASKYHALEILCSQDYEYLIVQGGGDAAVSLDDLTKIFKMVSNGSEAKRAGNYGNAIKKLDYIQEENAKNGLKVNISSGSIEKNIKELNELKEKISKKEENLSTNGGSDFAIDHEGTKSFANDLSLLYKRLTNTIASTLSAYSALLAFRSTTLKATDEYIKAHPLPKKEGPVSKAVNKVKGAIHKNKGDEDDDFSDDFFDDDEEDNNDKK
jgi:hypothetical protein